METVDSSLVATHGSKSLPSPAAYPAQSIEASAHRARLAIRSFQGRRRHPLFRKPAEAHLALNSPPRGTNIRRAAAKKTWKPQPTPLARSHHAGSLFAPRSPGASSCTPHLRVLMSDAHKRRPNLFKKERRTPTLVDAQYRTNRFRVKSNSGRPIAGTSCSLSIYESPGRAVRLDRRFCTLILTHPMGSAHPILRIFRC